MPSNHMSRRSFTRFSICSAISYCEPRAVARPDRRTARHYLSSVDAHGGSGRFGAPEFHVGHQTARCFAVRPPHVDQCRTHWPGCELESSSATLAGSRHVDRRSLERAGLTEGKRSRISPILPRRPETVVTGHCVFQDCVPKGNARALGRTYYGVLLARRITAKEKLARACFLFFCS